VVRKENLKKEGDCFTDFKIKIIRMIAEEKANKEIADELNLSQRAIEYHITNIFKKLNTSTRVGVVMRAIERKIITFEKGIDQ
jgi:two-component system competent response regulator ComA